MAFVQRRDVVTTTDEPVVRDRSAADVVARVVYIITGVIVGLLLFRFVLSLLGANRGNAFADLIYDASQPFVAPFFGLFNYNTSFGIARFEFETLIAAVVYILVAWLIVSIIDAADRRTV